MKILVIQKKMIGDVLVSSILCNNLKMAFPKAQIDYMVYEHTQSVLDGNPYIDHLVLFKSKHRKNWFVYLKLIHQLRKEKYDVVIDSYSKLESWFAVFFLRCSRRISYEKSGRSFLYTDNVPKLKVPRSNLGLIIERRLKLLEPLDLQIEIDPVPKLYLSEREIEFANALFSKHHIDTSKKTIMISILGSSTIKTLPLTEMSKFIDFIASSGDVNIVFNYFPKQIQEAKQILDGCNAYTQKKIYFDVLGNSLREFIAIMNMCDMIMGNDGGAINMAKALNKPSFIIFSPWIEKRMWSTFEDGRFHKSVHLQDFKQELFRNMTSKQLKRNALELYKELHLDLFKTEVETFLKFHLQKKTAKISNESFKIKKIAEVKLSVLIITYNEAHNVDDLMASLVFADEIIVVDSHSTDGTAEAFQKYPNVKFITHKFKDFSSQRNYAISLASNDWVFFVDADERVSTESQMEIRNAINNSGNTIAFGFYRRFVYNDKPLNFGGFQTDKVYRLFHKNYASYDPSKLVHETLVINGEAELMKFRLDHYSYSTDEIYKGKLQKYGKLRAEELFKNGIKPNFYYLYLKPAYRFFHLYIVRFGFLDGKLGVKMARLSAYGVHQRYVELKKLYN